MLRNAFIVANFFASAPLIVFAQEGKPKDGAPADKPPETKRSAIDERLLRNLDEGEDLGEEGKPLLRLGNKMQVVEGLLGQGKDAERTAELQQQIVSDLDRLIAEIKKRPASSSSSSSASSGKPRGPMQPQGNSDPNGSGQSNTPARDSSNRLGANQTAPTDLTELKKQLQNVWGDLPERDREQLFNAAGERFLPKYELLIEKYFRRLGEIRSGGQ